MAFTGTPVVKRVSDSLYRITGVSLAGSDDEDPVSGTIGLNLNPNAPAGPGEIDLWAPTWQPYEDVTLQDAVSVQINAVEGHEPFLVSVVKAGSTHADFLITLANVSGIDEGEATPELEIYVRYH